jgi:H/ACA ribonucleoprotein complex subunit 4
LNKATRLFRALLHAGKEYVAIMQLHADVDQKTLEQAVRKYTGRIKQLPPVRCAVKRRQRERTVYYADILEIEGRKVLLRIGCEAGTYVRKLIHDIGQELGTGAHMAELVRTKAGPFTLEQALTLQQLEDAKQLAAKGDESLLRKAVLAYEEGVSHMPKVWVYDTAVESLCHGAILHLPGIVRMSENICKEDMLAVLTLKNELVGLGIAAMDSSTMAKEQKGVAVRLNTVTMNPGTYPKMERTTSPADVKVGEA